MMGYGNGGGGMWAFGGVIMLGVLVLIVVAVWAMITVTKRHGAPVGVEPVTAVAVARPDQWGSDRQNEERRREMNRPGSTNTRTGANRLAAASANLLTSATAAPVAVGSASHTR